MNDNVLSKTIPTHKLFSQIHEYDEECDKINRNIEKSKVSQMYKLMNAAVKENMGSTFQLNWRWLDLNLFLCELKLHEFGKVDWYTDIDFGKADPRRDLTAIQNLYSSLSAEMKVEILRKSVIEWLDVNVAANRQNITMKEEEVHGMTANVIQGYEDALALDPHCIGALYNYADMMANAGRPDKTINYLSRLLLLDPDNARGWGMKALLCENEGKLNEAVDCYERAYRIDNTSTARLRNYAMLLVEVKNYEKAKSVYEELLLLVKDEGVFIGDSFTKGSSTVLGEYADLLHSMGLMAESRVAFEKAIAEGTANDIVINDYAALLCKIGKNLNDPRTFRMAVELWKSIKAPDFSTRVNLAAAKNDPLLLQPLSLKELQSCAICDRDGKMSCAKCKQVKYCGRECQMKHWPIHKRMCKKA
jgi:tetratricopeptide (TPR) repeat protein